MNVFTNLLFFDIGRPAEPHLLDDDDERYATGFGNRVASARVFAPLGHARRLAPAVAVADALGIDDAVAACCA
jgi:hypothetical protein